jgi:hypothetical protein
MARLIGAVFATGCHRMPFQPGPPSLSGGFSEQLRGLTGVDRSVYRPPAIPRHFLYSSGSYCQKIISPAIKLAGPLPKKS